MRETTFILLILLLNVHKQQTNKQETRVLLLLRGNMELANNK